MNTLLTTKILNRSGERQELLLNLDKVVSIEPATLQSYDNQKTIECVQVTLVGNQDTIMLDETFEDLVEELHNKE